jgi:diadenosine tetraphosphatase ApaH/serine/threonine PP2A family protein phosphatase
MFDLFRSYDEDDEEAYEWDEGPSVPEAAIGDERLRALCPDCGKPLRRYAKLPSMSVLLKCAVSKTCQRCSDTILPGEMHFVCRDCEDLSVCRSCGPGVYIERSYDYVDSCTGELSVRYVPQNVLHERKQRRRLDGRSVSAHRGLNFTQETARRVLEATKQVAERCASDHEDLFDREWNDPALLGDLLGVDDPQIISDKLCDLAQELEKLLRDTSRTSTLNEAPAPCKIFGDTHGQLRDVLFLFHYFGLPGTADCPAVVFNGDFVDRGQHQVELLAVLFSLKLLFPDRVFLNRGNHEDRNMNERYGFKGVCVSTLGAEHGQRFFEAAEKVFEQLPLATLVGQKILVLHGGIGDGNWMLKDLKEVQRPLSHSALQAESWLWNLLWSDPIEDDSDMASRKVFGAHPSPRSKSAVKFGWDVTQRFCAQNGLDLVVRSHQAKKQGLGFDVMHREMLIRVFSARDYESNRNDGAILHVSGDDDNSGMLSVRPQVLASLSEKW